MSDKELMARGAQLVAGDLILHRKTVGRYRHGQFVLTPEGADELQNVLEVSAVDVTPKPTPKTRAGGKPRGAKSNDVTDAAPKMEESGVDPAALDNLLDGLTD